MVHLISYTLHHPGRNYDSLYEAIKGISGVWWKHTTSAWIVQSSLSCQQIYNLLSSHVDANDEVVVFRLQGEWWGRILNPDNKDWMLKREF